MNNIKSIIALAAFSLAATTVFAQNATSGYFTDGYLYRHEMNPAFGNDQSYVAMPLLSNINVGIHSNIGIDDVIFNRNGRTTTFLNPNVSASEFMSGIKEKNKLSTDIKLQIMGVGFKGFGGYNSIGINIRSNVSANIPGTLFSLAKEGVQNKIYDISDLKVHADAYTEIAFGHSRQINQHLRIGANLKVLLGGANIDANFEKAELKLQNDQWIATTNATVQSSIKGLTYKEETKMRGAEGEKVAHTYVSDIDVDNGGINGFGLAVDLGAEYKLDNNWKFSASLLDLGFISWKNNVVASTNGDRTFTTDAYLFNLDDDADNKFSKEVDRMGEGLADLYELNNNGDQGGRTKALAATMNLGVEYTIPTYKNLSFGLLNTTRMQGTYSWTDFRLSANWRTSNLFSMGVNLAAGTYGTGFGWILNLHPKGFNLFLGMDHTLGKLTKQGAPLSGNGSLNIGINFPL